MGGKVKSGGLKIGCILLFTGRWAYNWGAYKGGGGLKSEGLFIGLFFCLQVGEPITVGMVSGGDLYPGGL